MTDCNARRELARSAPCDLWDVTNLPQDARARLRTPTFRSWLVDIVSVLNHPLSIDEVDSIGRRLTQSDVNEQLGPMLTGGKPSRIEDLVAAGEAPTQRLCADDDRASHLAEHPAPAWKLENVRRCRGKKDGWRRYPRQVSSVKKETAAPLVFENDAAVAGCTKIPPRGVEQPPDSGRETQNPPPPGTESGTPAADPLPELLALVIQLPPEAAALLLKIARRLSAAR